MVGEVKPTGHEDTEESLSLNHSGHFTYVSLKDLEAIKCYTTLDGIDWNIGGSLFNTLMIESGLCMKEDHDECNCDFVKEYGSIYIVTVASGKQYVVHPCDNELLENFIHSKRRKL